jgi:hypothetical protein
LRKHDVAVMERHYRGTAKDSPLAIDLSETVPETARRVPLILELGFPEGFRFPDCRHRPILAGAGPSPRRAYAIIVPTTSSLTTAQVSRRG